MVHTWNNHFGISTGLGISNAYNFFSHNQVLNTDPDHLAYFEPLIDYSSVDAHGPANNDAHRSFLRYWSLRLPVMLQLQWNLDNAPMSDIQAIRKKVKGIDLLSPILSEYSYNGENNVFFGIKGGNFSMKGLLPNYNEIDRGNILYGRYINETDIAEARKVCVLGKKVYEDVIGADKDPIGLMIKANGIYYQVVGVVQAYNSNVSISGSINETVILPLTTMQKAYNKGDKSIVCRSRTERW